MNAFLRVSLKILFRLWIVLNIAAVGVAIHTAAKAPQISLGAALMVIGALLMTTLWLYTLTVVILTIAALIKPNTPGYTMRKDRKINPPGVSVVIPIRNEEHNLKPLLESIDSQSYAGAMEVIFVDDGSEDNGVKIIKKFLDTNDRIPIKIIHLHDDESAGGLTSKQRALDLGVSHSSLPLVAFTDADVILSPNWIESLVDTHANADADLVFGHTSIITGDKSVTYSASGNDTGLKRSGIFALLESFQLELLFSFAYAFSKIGLSGSCMGNNLLVVKKRYEECGGQRGVGRSIVEDRGLMGLFRKNKLRIAAAEPFRATVNTYPARSKTQFFSQASRWVRGGLRPGGGLFAAGILLLTQNAVFLLAALGLISGEIAADTTRNFLLTWGFVAVSFIKNRSPAPILIFPLYYIFMMIETVVLGWMLLFGRKIDWKGRKL